MGPKKAITIKKSKKNLISGKNNPKSLTNTMMRKISIRSLNSTIFQKKVKNPFHMKKITTKFKIHLVRTKNQ